MSGFYSFVGDAPMSGSALVFGFFSSVGDLPGSDFSFFINVTTASDFPLHDSLRFSILNIGLEQADQLLSQVYRGNDEISTYPTT